MTLTTTSARNEYTGAGSVGPYAYTFRIFAATDLLVVTRNISSGAETTLAYVTDYSVTGVGEGAGGTITLTNALESGNTMAITRVVPVVQDTDLRNQGTFYPQTYENALDYLTAIDQQQQDAIDRSLKVGDGVDPATFTTTLATAPANSYLRVNGTGDAFVAVTVMDDPTVLYPVQPGEAGVVDTNYPVGNILRYGAVGDGANGNAAANDAAIEYALAAIPSGGTIVIPANTAEYVVDVQHYVTKSCTITGGGTIKLADQSALFHDSTNLYGRYVFLLNANNIRLDGVTLDGNSANNWVMIGGVKRYAYAGYSVGLVLTGFYGAGVTAVDLYNITITNCTIKNACAAGLDSYQQDTTKHIYGYRVSNNTFGYGQGVQCSLGNTTGGIITGNTFKNCYFASVQFYYGNIGTRVENNTVYFKQADLTMTLLDPSLYTVYGGNKYCNYCGEIRVGKLSAATNTGCAVVGNTLYGAPITVQDGWSYGVIADNVSIGSEQCGLGYQMTTTAWSGATTYAVGDVVLVNNIQYVCILANTNHTPPNATYWVASTSGQGNSILRNRFYVSDQPALYLSDAPATVRVEGNEMSGCCTNTLATAYPVNGYSWNSGVVIIANNYLLRTNTGRQVDSKPAYGVMVQVGKTVDTTGNDFRGAGATTDVVTATQTLPTGTAPVVSAHPTIGDLQSWTYQSSILDDNNAIALPSGVNGTVLCTADGEQGIYAIKADGTVTLLTGSANAVATDTNLKMCLYKNGTAANFKQRLGGTQAVTIQAFYR